MTSHSNKKFGVLSLSSLFFLGGLFSFSIECWLFKPFSYLFSKLCKCIKIFLSRDEYYVNEKGVINTEIKILKSVIIFQGMLFFFFFFSFRIHAPCCQCRWLM